MKPKNIQKKLDKRIATFEQSGKGRTSKWSSGYKRPGSRNQHKQG